MYRNNFNLGYTRQSFSPVYNRAYKGYSGAAPKKRSGCREKLVKEKKVIYGWNLSKGGFVSFVAVPYRSAKVSESQNGNEFVGYFVTLTNKTTKTVTNCSGLLNLTTGKLVIKELGMVANPKTNYFGTFKRR